jgi:hypothetical protein
MFRLNKGLDEFGESGWKSFLFAVFSILFLFRTVRGGLR